MSQLYFAEDGRIAFQPDKYPAEEIKEILGGRWNNKERLFYLAPISLNILKLVEWYGEDILDDVSDNILSMYDLPWGFHGFEEHPELHAKALSHPHWENLYPFQKEAVEYMVCSPHRGGIIGLSPGLGKTPVTVVAADILETYQCLILAPLTLARNWGHEVEAWSRYFRSYSRASSSSKDPITEFVITNFETLFFTVVTDEDGNEFNEEDDLWVRNAREVKKWIELGPKKKDPKTGKIIPIRKRETRLRPSYGEKDWELLVSDESILLKNRKAVKVDLVGELAKYSKNAWLLSGSPTSRFRDDLYPQCKIVLPKSFSAYWRFTEFFCVVEKGQWGWEVKSDRPDHDPQKYLKDVFFVRNQKDVLPDLPDYIYDPIEIDLNPDQQKAFRQMLDDWIVALEAEEEEQVVEGAEDLIATTRLAQRTRMLQITSNLCNLEKGAGKPMPRSSAKEDLLVDLIRQGDIEFPLLVWAWFKPSIESIDTRLEDEFGKDLEITYIHGGLTSEQKDWGIEYFKNGDIDVLTCQMGIGKFGHTFTDTKTVYYHDRTDDTDAYVQTLRRVRRIGLTHTPRLIVPRANFSADPIVELNLSGKLQSVAKVASHDLRELLQSLGGIAWSMSAYNTGIEGAVDKK